MTYDTWKTTEPEEFYPGPSRKQIADKLKQLDTDIAWNIGRLGYLVLSDEDRQQTEDYIMDLRQERESLKRCFNV